MSVDLPDFDALLAIHREDPEAFEHFRRHLLREAVDAAPPAHRQSLEELLVRIEAARASARDPVEAAAIAFRLMRASVERLQDSWDHALLAVSGLQARVAIEQARAA
ncbi:MAG TPA: DUF3135 domain-containing protein [Noviherbaspirillum sp.]|uniref:DUF3135 domain-containing protein n=1 Tax=Noviherbaspirillum sp. TaxID=1926288 RepID=UPI002F92ABA1